MAWTARDVSIRLRRELDEPRLVVRFDPSVNGGRWAAFLQRKEWTGARRWPVAIGEGGELAVGVSVIRELAPFDDLIYVLELDDQYHSLEPNLMREGLLARDTRRRDVLREAMAEIQRRRDAKQRRFIDESLQRALYYRRAFAKVADDMGLGGRPDYGQIYNPKRVYGI